MGRKATTARSIDEVVKSHAAATTEDNDESHLDRKRKIVKGMCT